ncbi:hypothetical protein BIY24_14390 [Halobacteriovorax marinus]|uniref:hypothetical protein n=1 Tax=Halobacteriovorax marinus TaxID=97084 RepID=UPI000BC362E6|nr:hypothetical protein [Halobacteriovorax marinus]ATH09088.1 hypothetical protein BIY24_14390 [Halobacteriovorax marinus]
MESKIKALTINKNIYKTYNIFAYASKGIPGLELRVGAKNSKILKEKMIYLTRISSIKIPLKRYVICVEESGAPLDKDELKWLELPILILYWSLAEGLPISKLDDCLCGGEITLDGVVRPLQIHGEYLKYFNSVKCEKVWKIITGKGQKECLGLVRLPVEEIVHLPLESDLAKSIGS